MHFAWETVSILDAAERSIQSTKRAAKKKMERVSFLHKHICLLYLQMAFSRGSIKSNLKANLARQGGTEVISEEAAAAFVQCP